MRSPAEIRFRLRQQAENLRLRLAPPNQSPQISKVPLPNPRAIAGILRDTIFADELTAAADQIMSRRIPLLGQEIRPEAEIRWRRDYIHDRETPPVYFERISYLNFERAGDHKMIWELNRHQHLVLLAQANLLSGRREFREELFSQLESWLDQNPVCRGINWTSALEVAFRALSWLWIQHLTGEDMPEPLGSRWRLALYHHGCYLERNLSFYFSPNTHLQGEALALHALGLLFGVRRWRDQGVRLMREMIRGHVYPDGGHFERSSYYHVYATDMFLFHAVLEPPDDAYRESLKRMARYLWALAGSGEMPFLGDDDGGRLFHPFGKRSRFARATLAACAAFFGDTPTHGDPRDLEEIAVWWLGDQATAKDASPRVSELFPDTGVAVLEEENLGAIASVHAFGRGSAGHSHAHSLHFILRHAGEEVLIDPGTYTYVSDPIMRNWFRGTAAHNTVRIDGLDQADPAGPFRWSNLPLTEILEWQPRPWRLRARCRYRDLCHERRIVFSEGALWVIDEISGGGRHRVEQFWHVGGLISRDPILLNGGMRLVIPEYQAVHIEDGWRSPVPGVKTKSTVLRIALEGELPLRLFAVFDAQPGESILRVDGGRLALGDRVLPL